MRGDRTTVDALHLLQGVRMIARPSTSVDPFDVVVGRLQDGKPRGDGVRATCPAHDDSKPSLDVDRGDGGRVLIRCRAGCSTEAVVEKLGLRMLDLFPAGDGRPAKVPKPAKEPRRYPSAEAVAAFYQEALGGTLTTFTYTDSAGAVVGQVLRYDTTNRDGTREKQIRQARPVDGGRAWIAEGPAAPVPIYQLPALLAAQPDEPVLVVEGEGKVRELQGLGFVATCSMRGANGFAKSDWSPLAGRHIVILPDNDKPGADYRDGVAALAHEAVAGSVSVLDLPGLGDGCDVVDWAAARRAEGRTNDEIAAELRNLVALAKRAPEPEPTCSEPAAQWTPFPSELLPHVLRQFVEHGADVQGVDVAYWGVPLLGVLAGCIGATRRIRLKSDWLEPCVLWTAPVAASGMGKSPPLRALLVPVREHDYAQHLRTVQQQAAYAEELAAWKANKCEGTQPIPPPLLASLIDDATTEAIAVRLADNPRGLLLASDELAAWLKSMNQYRAGSDEQKWLSIHNCDGIKVDRKSAPGGNPARVYVRRAAVSVVGTIQPAIARKLLGGEDSLNSGQAARMLLAQPPIGSALWNDREVDPEVRDAYGRVVRSLLDLGFDELDEPIRLTLSREARAQWVAFHDMNVLATTAAAIGGELSIAALLSKVRGAGARIALVLALAKAAEDGTAELLREVDAEAMQAGIELAKWFEGEGRRLYASWQIDDEAEGGQVVADRMEALAEQLAAELATGPKSLADLHAATGRNRSGDELRGALERLRGDGRADCQKVKGPHGGRPREVWVGVTS